MRLSMIRAVTHKEGQGLIDVLIGITLLTIGISFATILVFGGQKLVTDRDRSAEASALSEEGARGSVAAVKSNWNNVADGTYGLTFSSGTWTLSGTSTLQNGYLRQLTITTVTSTQKEIKSIVSWTTDDGRTLTSEIVTLATNWSDVVDTGGDVGCTGLSGDWNNPRTLGMVDLSAGNSATDLDAKDDFLYVSSVASDSRKPDFFVIDATDGAAPRVIGNVHTGSGIDILDVAGNYAYVGNRSGTGQLQIIDVTNRASPQLVRTFALPQSSSRPTAIFYADRKVYIGTGSNSGREFHVVDVANVNQPIFLGAYEFNTNVNAIFVRGRYAYVATPRDNEITILDVLNPAAIVEVGAYSAPGNSEDGKDISIVGNRLYLARTLGANHSYHHELHILDITDPIRPLNLGSRDFSVTINVAVGCGTIAFVGTSDSNAEFQMYNVSNPASITHIGSFNFPQVGTGIDFENNRVYMSVRSNDGLRIIAPGL